MSIQPLQLDTLTWKQMADATRGRIAAVSHGRWTLHAPVDPGVTQLELLAALLEERLYWMDHPSDAMHRALLRLLGVTPRAAVAAATVLAFVARDPCVVEEFAAGKVMQLHGDDRTFSTLRPVSVLPVSLFSQGTLGDQVPVPRVELEVGGASVRVGAAQYPAVCLFSESSREARLTVAMDTCLIAVTGVLSLLMELDTPSSVESEWLANSNETPSSACTLSWFFENADGSRIPVDAEQLEDGTAGLRRSGVVRLPLPEDSSWRPRDVDGLAGYTIVIRREGGFFSFIPRVRRIVPNATIAEHRRPARLDDEATRAALAGQIGAWVHRPGHPRTLVLPESERPPLTPSVDEPGVRTTSTTVTVRLREVNAGATKWAVVDDLAFAGPDERVLVVDRDAGMLRFGDARTGRLPVPDVDGADEALETLLYEVGGGERGNVGASRWWVDPDDLGHRAFNPVVAAGGAEPEAMASAVDRAGAAIDDVRRTVIASDFRALALSTPNVAIGRAHAAIGYHPDFPCLPIPGAITVFVVPGLPASLLEAPASCGEDLVALRADKGALEAVRQRLENARLVTQEIYVATAAFVELDAEVEVEGSTEGADVVRQKVAAALRSYLDPLRGGDDEKGWPFGDPVRPSGLLKQAQLALGDERTARRVGLRAAGTDAAMEFCKDWEIGDHDLVALRSVSVRFVASAIAGGTLS